MNVQHLLQYDEAQLVDAPAVSSARLSLIPQKVSGRDGFRFLHPSEFMAQSAPPQWLVRGYLEAGRSACMIGDPASYKTFAAIDLSMCIATGTSWHGQAVPNPGPVFYIVGEGYEGLKKRVQAWCLAHGKDPMKVPFHPSSAPAQFLNEESAAQVAHAVEDMAKQYGPPRLIVIDTLSRNFGDGDENTQRDMGIFVARTDLLKAKWGCSNLIVHHTGLSDKNRARGSSVLRAAADFEYNMKKKGNAVVLSCTKCKDHAEPANLAFKPTIINTGWTDPDTGQEITSCVLQLTDPPVAAKTSTLKTVQRKVLDALEIANNECKGPVTLNVWRETAYDMSLADSDEKSATQKAFSRAKLDLKDLGLVREEDGLWSIVK